MRGVPGGRRAVGRVTAPPTAGRGADRNTQRGSASVLVALWAVVLAVVASAGIVLTSALAARETVSAAADLAALAGASSTLSGPASPCARATRIASANGAVLTQCRSSGAGVRVTARAPAPAAVRWLTGGRAGHLTARAHAELAAELP